MTRPMEPFRGATFSCLQEEDLDTIRATVGHEIDPSLVIVDGSNAVHAVAVRGRDHANARGTRARGRLLEIVASTLSAVEVVVVFDDPGPVPGGSEHAIEVVHAVDADEWILARIAEAGSPHRVTVITSDRDLSRRVEVLGAVTERPREALAADRTAGES